MVFWYCHQPQDFYGVRIYEKSLELFASILGGNEEHSWITKYYAIFFVNILDHNVTIGFHVEFYMILFTFLEDLVGEYSILIMIQIHLYNGVVSIIKYILQI